VGVSGNYEGRRWSGGSLLGTHDVFLVSSETQMKLRPKGIETAIISNYLHPHCLFSWNLNEHLLLELYLILEIEELLANYLINKLFGFG
jgi:hypothetical protein